MTNPGDIVRIRSRNGGRASVYEANMWAQPFSQGLLDGVGVIQNTSPDMNVRVGGSSSNPDVVLAQNAAGYKIALDIVGQQAVLITAPASNSRIASIVAYSNDLSLQSTQTSITGTPNSCGLIVVYGTSASSPTPPSDSVIRSAITSDGATGSQAVYCVIANITVAASTTAITNILISTQRATIGSDTLAQSAVKPKNVDSASFRLLKKSLSSQFNVSTTATAISGFAGSFTLAESAEVRIDLKFTCAVNQSNGSIAVVIKDNGAIIDQGNVESNNATFGMVYKTFVEDTFAAGTHNISVEASMAAGTSGVINAPYSRLVGRIV